MVTRFDVCLPEPNYVLKKQHRRDRRPDSVEPESIVRRPELPRHRPALVVSPLGHSVVGVTRNRDGARRICEERCDEKSAQTRRCSTNGAVDAHQVGLPIFMNAWHVPGDRIPKQAKEQSLGKVHVTIRERQVIYGALGNDDPRIADLHSVPPIFEDAFGRLQIQPDIVEVINQTRLPSGRPGARHTCCARPESTVLLFQVRVVLKHRIGCGEVAIAECSGDGRTARTAGHEEQHRRVSRASHWQGEGEGTDAATARERRVGDGGAGLLKPDRGDRCILEEAATNLRRC
mmetsp:Transcript_47943/g.154681  ORF Transcript_47943/g.154681 Transcript_47943/m.154681 type:complete len:289 (-) Transcript_47943:1117-1983(-)